jgi:Tfp pilus assembly protein PilO
MRPQRFFYVLCGIAVALLAAGGAGYYFASRYLSDGTVQLSQRLADEQLSTDQLGQLKDLEQQYQRLEPLLPIIMGALPQQKDQTKLALQLRNIAATSGMELGNLNFTASATPGPVSQTVKVGDVLAIPVTFQLSGTYPQLQQFLVLQERLDRYTNVTSLNINNNPEGNGELKFDISLNAFMKP